MNPAAMSSAMRAEALESADRVEALLSRRAGFEALARAISIDAAPLALICGRGSSGHAGAVLRYLIEARLGLPVCAAAPSVTTLMDRKLKLDGALFLVISQSGGSPDIVAATEAARQAGAVTIALLNRTQSPLAQTCEHVVDIGAGPERSVAATKSVIASLAAGALLVAALARDEALFAALATLPARLRQAAGLDWSPLTKSLAQAPCLFVAARGYGLGIAREIALKCAETLRLPALAYSAAELMHGPRAALNGVTPLLALPLQKGDGVRQVAEGLEMAGVPVLSAGVELPWLEPANPLIDAVAMLLPAYLAIEAAARLKGFDPDNPPHLVKVTRTL